MAEPTNENSNRPEQINEGKLMFGGLVVAVFSVPVAYLVFVLCLYNWDEEEADLFFWIVLLSGLAVAVTVFMRGLGRRLGWWD